MEEFYLLMYSELKTEFSSGACGGASFQKQRCSQWLVWRWVINACKRPGCLSKEQTICLSGKEHKDPRTPQPCLQTPRNELHLHEGSEVWQGGELWRVQVAQRLGAALASEGAHSHVGIWQQFSS